MKADLSIYIGAAIEHGSERSVIEHVVELLDADGVPAVVFANVSVSSRQIDLVVARDDLTLVIEAKSWTRPLRGRTNGLWKVHTASGLWKEIPNPCVQARGAALAVKNAMSSFTRTDMPFLEAALIFTPAIPTGSDIEQGNRSVSVIGLDGLRAQLRKRQNSSLPIDRWKAFAEHLRLTPVSKVAAASDPALFEAEDLLRQYVAAFRDAYTPPAPLVPFTCRTGGETVSSDEVVRLVAERRADVSIQGPSGCGKTLLAVRAGLEFIERNGVPVILPVKCYSGSLKQLLDREVGLLSDASAATLLAAARRLDRPLLFIVDGYNECTPSERSSLTRALAALARKYESGLLVTSQCPLARGDLLSLRAVEVPPATPETKTAIALGVTGGDTLPRELERLLGAVSTGLEARLLAEVGQQLGEGCSRYALFDAFVRKRMGNAARDGIRFLSHLAGWLCDRIAFSLSERDLDRLMDREGVPHVVAAGLRTAGLLSQRADRIGFAHELFFQAFAAENVIRRAADRAASGADGAACPAACRTTIVHHRCDRRRSPAKSGVGRSDRPSSDCRVSRRELRPGGPSLGGGALCGALGTSSRGGARGQLRHLETGLDGRRLRESLVDCMERIGPRLFRRDAEADGRGP